MSITIVIADDEPISRKSQEAFIRKEFPDLEIVGIACDGIELKKMLEEKEPDLAMIDIRMPGLTGLEAIELVSRHKGGTHFIINTAYSDFDYVKRALDLKVDGYLLKPAKRQEKIEVVRRLCTIVENERQQRKQAEMVQDALLLVNPVLGSELLGSIVSGTPDQKAFDTYLAVNGWQFGGGCIITFLCNASEKEGKPAQSDLQKLLDRALDGICHYLVSVTGDSIVLMLFEDFMPEDQEESWSEEIAELITQQLWLGEGTRYLYGVGGVRQSFSRMTESWEESKERLSRKSCEEQRENDGGDRTQEYVQRAEAFLQRHFREDISLTDCAEEVGISPYYLSHIMKDNTGSTFVERLTEIRMAEARRLCRETDLTIREMAQRCGYENVTYFCKVFKKITGSTIGEYRKGGSSNV